MLEKDGEGAAYLDEMIWGVEDDFMHTQNYIEDEYKEIVDDFSIDMDEWKSESWTQRQKNFKWFFHFVIVGLPYLFMDVCFQTANLLMNAFGFHMWGDLNWILLYNTYVSLFQGLTSFLLISEVPTYMKHMRMVRAFSFSTACVYNFFYFWGVAEYFYGDHVAQIQDDYFSGFAMLIEIFVVFNLAFYFPIAFMNMVIIGRELRFEFFQHNRKLYYGGTRDELVLGVSDMWHGFWDFVNLFNPLWYVSRLFIDRKKEEDLADAYLDELTDAQLKEYDLDF